MVTDSERDYLWSVYAADRGRGSISASGAASPLCWRATAGASN